MRKNFISAALVVSALIASPAVGQTAVAERIIVSGSTVDPLRCDEAQTILREARELQTQGEAERQLIEQRRRLDLLGAYVGESLEQQAHRQQMNMRQSLQRLDEMQLVMHAQMTVENLCSR